MTPDPAGMAAADPANPQSWNRYAYVMNNPLNATDPLGLCYFGDGHTIGTTYPGRVIGEECNSGALDSDQPCENSITDASCPGTPVGPGPDPAGTPDSYFNSFIVQSHDQDLADYQGTVDCGYNPGTCDPSKKPAGYIILVICGGSSTDITCLPPDEAALGSFGFRTNALYPGLAPGDVPLNPQAQKIFSQIAPIARTMNNPCTFAAFEAGSAIMAVGGDLAGAREAVAGIATLLDGYGVPATGGIQFARRVLSSPTIVMRLNQLAGKVQQMCNSLN